MMHRTRTGLRIRGQRGQPEVREALKRFAKWLRQEYEFPIRVPVYLSKNRYITAIDGDECSASFFGPYERDVEPYIRIATGDYDELLAKSGKYVALGTYMCSLAHEVLHYQQWVAVGRAHERGVARKAAAMVRRYAEVVHELQQFPKWDNLRGVSRPGESHPQPLEKNGVRP